MNLKSILTAFALLVGSFAHGVSESNFSMVYDLLDQKNGAFYTVDSFLGEDHKIISYAQFGFAKGAQGSLMILPGRTESSLKYIEVAYDFIQKGYAPVFVIDHRGQGFSERLLPDPQKGYVGSFDDYTKDFSSFVEIVKLNTNVDKNKLFVMSHSMGGAVLTDYLIKNPMAFKKVVMIAPMHGIALEKSVNDTLSELRMACTFLGRCKDYIPGGGPYRLADRSLATEGLTSSSTRFQFRDELWRRFPQLQLGSPTLKWVLEAIKSNIASKDIAKLSKIKTKVLILQAGKDTVVKNKEQVQVCSRFKNLLCQVKIVKGARHEILMEKDSLRDPALNEAFNFFK